MDLFDDAVSSVDSAVTDRSGAAEFIPRRDDGDESGTGPRCEVCDLSSHVTPVKSLREMCKQVRVRFAQNVAHVSVPQIKCDDLRSLTMAERHALRHHIAVVLCTQRQQPMPAAAPAPTPPLIADFVAAVEHENSYDPLVHSDFGTDIRNAQPGHPGPAAHFVLAACVPPATQADLDAAVKDFEQRLLDTTIAAMLGIATDVQDGAWSFRNATRQRDACRCPGCARVCEYEGTAAIASARARPQRMSGAICRGLCRHNGRNLERISGGPGTSAMPLASGGGVFSPLQRLRSVRVLL